MPYANVTELRFCLKDCIKFCEDHPEKEYCEVHGPRLEEALDNLMSVINKTDKQWSKFMSEKGEDKVAWKKLAKALSAAQRELASVDAIGYPDAKLQYWYEERLARVSEQMVDYLESRKDAIDFAESHISKLETALDAARGEDKESNMALREYNRYAGSRKDAIADCNHVIGGFRDSIRRDLGKDDEEYQSIRWAQSVAPDKTVL
jgi:chromosome segregation ATPase